MGSLEIQIFVSLFVILGAAFVALLCDFLKGNNERLRERNIELQTRHEERDKREVLLEQAQRQAWNVAVQAQEAAAAQLSAQAEESAREEARRAEEVRQAEQAPAAPSVEPLPGLAKAPNPQDDRGSHAEPAAAVTGPIVPTPQDAILPTVALTPSEPKGLGEEGPQYPEPRPFEVRISPESPALSQQQAVHPDSGLEPAALWSGRDSQLGGEAPLPQQPLAPMEPQVRGGDTVQLPSHLPHWVPMPVRELLGRSLPMAGQVPYESYALPASLAGADWKLVSLWSAGHPLLPASPWTRNYGLTWAGLAALPPAPVQTLSPPSSLGSRLSPIAPSVALFVPVLGVGVTVGLRSGHLKPITLPALALRASLAQLPLELPIPTKKVFGRPPSSDLSVESDLPRREAPDAAEAGLVPEALRPASIAPIVADVAEASLPRVESTLPRFSGEPERSLPLIDQLACISIPGAFAPQAIERIQAAPLPPAPLGPVLPRYAPETARHEFAGTALLSTALPSAAIRTAAFRGVAPEMLPVSTGSGLVPSSALSVQPVAFMRDASGVSLSGPLPSRPATSSFYPFAPLLERAAEGAKTLMPEQRFELDEVQCEEPAVQPAGEEPVVRIRVLQDEDLRPLGDLTPLAAGAPGFFNSTLRSLEFREEAPAVEGAPFELEAGYTIEGGFAHDPVALQSPPRPPSRVVVMPAFDDLRAMFSPAAPSLQQRPEPPGNILRMPAPPPSESLPAGMQDAAELERVQRRASPFSGAVMVVTIADHQKAVQQHGEEAVNQVLGDVQAFVAEAAGAGAFLSRTPDHELVFAWPRERVSDPQRVFHAVTEKLWDYQLRTLGGVAVIFSWGFHETDGDSFSRALGAARDQMLESRRPRRTTMTGVGRFRRLMVS